MIEKIKEKIIITELRPFLRSCGWIFYMSLKCCSGDSDIFNVIDEMRFKLVVSWKDDEDGDSQMKELFESPNWVQIDISTRERNGFEYYEGYLDVYELTQGESCFDLQLSDRLEDVFPDSEEDKRDEQVEVLEEEIIENMTGDGDLDEMMESAIVQYIKTYF